MTIQEKYIDKMNTMPVPGGNVCHTAILGAANLGLLSGLDAEQIFSDIPQRRHLHFCLRTRLRRSAQGIIDKTFKAKLNILISLPV